jgi:PAS domain S-box-containing protein
MKNSFDAYQKMIEEIEDYAILLLDREGNVLNWNRGAEKIKGYKAAEIIGKNFQLFYSKEDRENGLPVTLIQKAFLEGKASDEGWRIRKDGSRFWGSILITAYHDEANNIAGFSKVTRDLTDRKIREDARRNTEEQLAHLAAIVENSEDAIISKTIEGVITSWNRGAEKMYGYTSVQAVGKDISMIVPETYQHEEKMVIDKICNNETIEPYETVRIRKNGEQFYISSTASSHKNAEGVIVGVSIISQDITARKKAEDSSKLKDAFLSIISHEIRTPLNAILGFSNILLKRGLAQEEKDYVGVIKTAGENLLALITDIIDMSRIEAGAITFGKAPYNVRDLFLSLQEMHGPAASDKGLNLAFRCEDQVPQAVPGDDSRMKQIITCLINNSIKFTGSGTIDVHCGLSENPKGLSMLKFVVTDTGIGIASDKLMHIFDRFRQTEPHNNRTSGGLGLGLTIAKRLVELQGGTMSVKSEFGQGSEFSFSIPL